MSVLSPGRNLVLMGLMGVGKSTVGKRLARRLGRPFVDTDEVVVRHSGRTIDELFAESEWAFREAEAEAVRHVSALRGQIMAIGGGAVMEPMNVTNLRATGELVLLDAMANDLVSRLHGGKGRPMLEGAPDLLARIRELQEQRAPAYLAAADHRVDTTGLGHDEIAEEILEWARTRAGLLNRDERLR